MYVQSAEYVCIISIDELMRKANQQAQGARTANGVLKNRRKVNNDTKTATTYCCSNELVRIAVTSKLLFCIAVRVQSMYANLLRCPVQVTAVAVSYEME